MNIRRLRRKLKKNYPKKEALFLESLFKISQEIESSKEILEYLYLSRRGKKYAKQNALSESRRFLENLYELLVSSEESFYSQLDDEKRLEDIYKDIDNLKEKIQKLENDVVELRRKSASNFLERMANEIKVFLRKRPFEIISK